MKISGGTNIVARGDGGIITKKYSELKPFEQFAYKDEDKVIVASKGLAVDEMQFSSNDWGKVFDYLMRLDEVK
jgi:hypothetical protein